MDTDKEINCNYIVMDPAGNITALAESSVEISRQPFIAEKIMQMHPEVEQVGFVSFESGTPALRMAGGEFCGNASMCAAALLDLKKQGGALKAGEKRSVKLQVSGAASLIEVELKKKEEGAWSAGVQMPAAIGIEERKMRFLNASGLLPLVRMQGISHFIIEEGSAFYSLNENKEQAEEAARRWCEELGAEGLGLLFLCGAAPKLFMTPLVYIPKSGTIFWEHSCGSGSAACGMYLAEKTGTDVSLLLQQPGGNIRVESSLSGGSRMFGTVRLLGRYSL